MEKLANPNRNRVGDSGPKSSRFSPSSGSSTSPPPPSDGRFSSHPDIGLAIERLSGSGGETRDVAQQAAQEVLAALSEAEDTIVTLLEENRALRAYMEEMNASESINFGDMGSTASNSFQDGPGADPDFIDYLYRERVRDWNMRRSGSGSQSSNSGREILPATQQQQKPLGAAVPKLKLTGLGGMGTASGLVSRTGGENGHPRDGGGNPSPHETQPSNRSETHASGADDKKKVILGMPKLNLSKVEPYSESSPDPFQQPLAAPRGERSSAQVGVYIERAVVVEGVRGRTTPREEAEGGNTSTLAGYSIDNSFVTSTPNRYTHTFGASGNAGTSGAVGLYIEHAIIVFGTTRGGPAEKSGRVKAGDVLQRVDGRSCVNNALHNVLPLLAGDAGSTVTLSLLRPSTNSEYSVTITRAPASSTLVLDRSTGRGASAPGYIGLQIDLGVLIRSLVDGGAAASSGIIKRGDVLEKVNGEIAAPQSLDSLRRQITGTAGTRVTLRIWRPPGLLQMDVCLTRTT